MRVMIRTVLVSVLFGGFTVAASELPPEITMDKCLLQAEWLSAKGDYGAALEALNKAVDLQREHNLRLPEEFHFKYARVALSEGSIKIAMDSVNKYLTAAGMAARFYGEALELLDQAKQRSLPIRPEMVEIQAGVFRMGCVLGKDCGGRPQPVHEVRVGMFELSKYEVTFAEYERFTAATGRRWMNFGRGWGRGRRPVIYVSWEDAVAYTEWLSEATGERYRLPSEAEWEYAARAGTETAYSWGNEIGHNRANCEGCGSQWDNKKTAPVGSFSANGWGVHDMPGNVLEWVQDCWNKNYQGAPTDGSAWESGDCDLRVWRGGSLAGDPRNLRSAYRSTSTSGDRFLDVGFRVARTITP